MSLTQENATDLHSVGTASSTVGWTHGLYHRTTFYPLVAICYMVSFSYNKPKAKPMHGSNHTEHYKKYLLSSRTHKTRLHFSPIYF